MPHDFILSFMGLMIPIIALLIPLVAVVAHLLVKPIARILEQRLEAERPAGALPADDRIPELERQIAQLQSSLQRVLEEQEFERRLRIGAPQS